MLNSEPEENLYISFRITFIVESLKSLDGSI